MYKYTKRTNLQVKDDNMTERRLQWASSLPGVWGFKVKPGLAVFIIKQGERFL